MYFQDKLPEGGGLVSCRAYRRYVEVEQGPGSGMFRYPDRCHVNQAARSVGPSPGPFVPTAMASASGGGLRGLGRSTDPEVGRRRFSAIQATLQGWAVCSVAGSLEPGCKAATAGETGSAPLTALTRACSNIRYLLCCASCR
jgi:hypothetical protein